MVLIRSARRTDTPATATLSVAAFAHDELYCYLNPHKTSYPDHFRNYFLRRYKLRLVDPAFHFLVAELEPGDEGYVGEGGDGDNVVGFAIWTCKSPSPSPDSVAASRRQTWAEWVEWTLLRANDAYIHAFQLDRALSYPNFHRIMGPASPSPFALDPYALVPERWHLSNLAVAPAFQGRGIASRLMDWGLDIARREGVPVTLTTSLKAEPVYRHRGFKTLVTFDIEGVRMGAPVLVWGLEEEELERCREEIERAGKEGKGGGGGSGLG
ncbi:MAG: hypothetical protein LQ342_008122 [Letrouitia transgressa]|nr:MAG: hypothetical protein LQ342_008122 [Letrouitia transgressa]